MTPEEAKTKLAEAVERERAAMTEAERKTAEAAERERKAEERERAATERERAADVRAALLEAGVKVDKATRAAQLVIGDLGDKAKADEIKTAVDTVKADAPEWFGDGTTPPPAPAAPGGPPASNPPNTPPPASQTTGSPDDALARGKAEAEKRQHREPATTGA